MDAPPEKLNIAWSTMLRWERLLPASCFLMTAPTSCPPHRTASPANIPHTAASAQCKFAARDGSSRAKTRFQWSLGMIRIRSSSTFFASVSRVSPSRYDKRSTCVSTTTPSAFFERDAEHHIRRLARDARQASAACSIVSGTFPPNSLTTFFAAPEIDFALFVIKPRRPNLLLDRRQRSLGEGGRSREFLKQRRRDDVHARIRALRRQDRRTRSSHALRWCSAHFAWDTPPPAAAAKSAIRFGSGSRPPPAAASDPFFAAFPERDFRGVGFTGFSQSSLQLSSAPWGIVAGPKTSPPGPAAPAL